MEFCSVGKGALLPRCVISSSDLSAVYDDHRAVVPATQDPMQIDFGFFPSVFLSALGMANSFSHRLSAIHVDFLQSQVR